MIKALQPLGTTSKKEAILTLPSNAQYIVCVAASLLHRGIECVTQPQLLQEWIKTADRLKLFTVGEGQNEDHFAQSYSQVLSAGLLQDSSLHAAIAKDGRGKKRKKAGASSGSASAEPVVRLTVTCEEVQAALGQSSFYADLMRYSGKKKA